MPKFPHIKKVLVIGSGPIVIGQAAEFDYAGTQACRALKQAGVEVVLANSNPATIMTDPDTADRVYVEPLTTQFLAHIIRKERPDGILPTLGGQTALNLAVELAESGVLKREGVRLLGTDLDAIQGAEDRERFRSLMLDIGQPIPESAIVHTAEEAVQFAAKSGYPVIVRPAFTLGGTGGGIADSEDELLEIMEGALTYSPIGQALVEQSVAGYKEIEFEVIRDRDDNCVAVCHMENVDPVGVHTGDSIVVAPALTLAADDLARLKEASFAIIRKLQIEGGCNVQYAFDPNDGNYYVIEVNPRVSRSSALASKATGYPIAKVSSLIALGYTLAEIVRPVAGQKAALFEPELDYVVTKIPRWPFDKFPAAERRLGTQMKATGEVMALGATFAESLQKAVRSLELEVSGLQLPAYAALDGAALEERVCEAHDMRLFALTEALRRGYTVEHLHALTAIDHFFLGELARLVALEQRLTERPLQRELLMEAKSMGFSDATIAAFQGCTIDEVRALSCKWRIRPTFKQVDTCLNRFGVQSPYLYRTFAAERESAADGAMAKADGIKAEVDSATGTDRVTEAVDSAMAEAVGVTVEANVGGSAAEGVLAEGRRDGKPPVIVLGSGPIRIGQGIEFDYATVHAVQAIREAGYEAVIINNNPETVSTDFDISDRLYFEPLDIEDVLAVVNHEQPLGVVVQFGGQTSLNLARELDCLGIPILGTTMANISRAEDREQFEELLAGLHIRRPRGVTVNSVQEAHSRANTLGFPVLVRPSYVLGGRAMQIVYSDDELATYLQEAVAVNPDQPVLIDRYVRGKEIEVDALCDGENVLVPGIMEHLERAGVHSGDSIAVYPTQSLSDQEKEEVVAVTTRIARALDVRGLLNIQFVSYEDELYVIEVNPRASRTVPFLSKVTGLPLARLATNIMLGDTLSTLGLAPGLWPEGEIVAVKVPVFSFAKLSDVEVTLGPEMKSTGEVMGRDATFPRALYKGFASAGLTVPREGTVLVTVADKDKQDVLPLVKRLGRLGYRLVATVGTAQFLRNHGLPVETVAKLSEGAEDILQLIRQGAVDMVVNTWTRGREPQRDGFRIRRGAVENGVPCLTSLDTLAGLLITLEEVTFTAEPLAR
ncbi:carbamoyl-phosphate synthase large subunit [Numidum massiliense]|uniref:carbamoyl-phosphate synthase large subunit n=1 Tax=Numidum massiliense TaxID=1522315 RepID=UPI0006D57B80|nr:carbamoyl-phosphate synthase large subunit [Numidum massiliense]